MKTENLTLLAMFIIGLAILAPTLVFAQNQPFVPLTGVPGVDPNTDTLEPYIKALYFLSIGLASALAVIKIIMAGVKYMLSDVVTDKGKAKSDIRSALIGLLLILGAVTILNEINPNLTNLHILRNADPVSIENKVAQNDSTYCAVQPPPLACLDDDFRECVENGGKLTKSTVWGDSCEEQEIPECPAGQVMMECATDDSADYQCRVPGDTSWCEGVITTDDDLNPLDETNTGTWVVTITGFDAEGDSPAMQADDLEELCEDEGGEPEIEFVNDTTLKVTCHK